MSVYQQIIAKATQEELITMMSAPSEVAFQRLFLQLMTRPSATTINLERELRRCFEKDGWTVEYIPISGNVIVNFPRTARVTSVSIRENRYGGYELALLDNKNGGLRYIHSIGYSDICCVNTVTEVINEIQRIFSELKRLQREHNKKRHNRQKIRTNL